MCKYKNSADNIVKSFHRKSREFIMILTRFYSNGKRRRTLSFSHERCQKCVNVGIIYIRQRLHLMPHHGVLIPVPPERALLLLTLYQTGVVVLVHICRAVIIFVFFVVDIICTGFAVQSSIVSKKKLTGRKPSLQEIMADFGFFIQPSKKFPPPAASSFTKDSILPQALSQKSCGISPPFAINV